MKRYYIIEGDVTSAGGIFQRHTGSAQTTKVYDKIVSNIGDKINCPACGAVGTIAAVGHRQPFGNHSNIPAMENDICLCKCSPPPILKHSQELFSQNVDYSIASAMEAFNLSLPNLQQDLNNNLVDDGKSDICACNREITLNDLKSLAVGSTKHLSNFIAPLNDTFKLYDIKTCIQKAYFISQTFLETSEYKTLEEGVSAQKEQTTYNGYKGRGLIQLTWKDNYVAYGKYKGEDFTGANRIKIATPKYAVDSAAWFWRKGKSRDLNDLATKNDLIGVSAIVNGGFNHFDNDGHGGKENRKAYLLKAFKTLNVKNCKNIPPSTLNTLEEFKLENSVVYNMVGESFGWGLWHDAEFKKIGCTKSLEETTKGYSRFLELAQTKKFQPSKRYGYTINQAKEIAMRKLK